MGVTEVIYGLCSIAFIALIALMLARGRISGPGIAIGVACALTAVWAADLAMPDFLPQAADLLGSLRLSAWLLLLVTLVGLPDQRRRGSVSLPVLLTIGYCVIVVGYEAVVLIGDFVAIDVSP